MFALKNLLSFPLGLVDPKTRRPVQFKLKRNQRVYKYYAAPNGDRFCYTPHKDVNGDYWVFTVKGKGVGSRTGNPRYYQTKAIVRCAKRKTAFGKAAARYYRATGITVNPPTLDDIMEE